MSCKLSADICNGTASRVLNCQRYQDVARKGPGAGLCLKGYRLTFKVITQAIKAVLRNRNLLFFNSLLSYQIYSESAV